jgi:hypothetical protein
VSSSIDRNQHSTGSRVEVTLTAAFVSRESLREAYPRGAKITDGWGVGGASRSYVVRAAELSLGSVTTAQPFRRAPCPTSAAR